MRITDKHIFFWRDPIAQWNMSAMKDPITGIVYNCSEQYMMHQKALLFEDEVRAKEIMKAAHPRDQQALGRIVSNYNQATWDAHKYNIVLNACMLKFTQHTKHLVTLLDPDACLEEQEEYDPLDDPKWLNEVATKAFSEAAIQTMEVMGYNVIAKDGYVVKVFKDGRVEQIKKIGK